MGHRVARGWQAWAVLNFGRALLFRLPDRAEALFKLPALVNLPKKRKMPKFFTSSSSAIRLYAAMVCRVQYSGVAAECRPIGQNSILPRAWLELILLVGYSGRGAGCEHLLPATKNSLPRVRLASVLRLIFSNFPARLLTQGSRLIAGDSSLSFRGRPLPGVMYRALPRRGFLLATRYALGFGARPGRGTPGQSGETGRGQHQQSQGTKVFGGKYR